MEATMRVAILAAITALSLTPAHAQMRTGNDIGGKIGTYVEKYANARANGERVVVDGACLSACTLVLGIVPREKTCATPRAVFGFHAAWTPDADHKPVHSASGTRILMDLYPPRVRQHIRQRGGLKQKMFYTRATAFLPRCPAHIADAPRNMPIAITVAPAVSAHAAR